LNYTRSVKRARIVIKIFAKVKQVNKNDGNFFKRRTAAS